MSDTASGRGSAVSNLVGLLGSLTADDVEAVDEQIAAKKAAQAKAIRDGRAEIESLVSVRDLIARRVGLPPIRTHKKKPAGSAGSALPQKPKASPQPEKAPAPAEPSPEESAKLPDAGTLTRSRMTAAARLLIARGITPGPVIQKECEIPAGSMGSTIRMPWFMWTVNGYKLTDVGRKELLGK